MKLEILYKPMTIQEIDDALDQFVDGVIFADDRFFYSIDELAEHFIDEAADEDELPETVNGAWKQLFDYCSAGKVAKMIWDDVVRWDFAPRKHRTSRNYCNAENLTDWALEHLYDRCEDDQDCSDVRGLDNLQSALDVFRSLNQTIWLLTKHIKAYDPAKHSIGLKSLQKALDKAAALNRHHFAYSYKGSQSVKLTTEWWLNAGWTAD